jgi:hypothetical protein
MLDPVELAVPGFPPLAARLGVALSAANANSIAAIATNFVKDISPPHLLNPKGL